MSRIFIEKGDLENVILRVPYDQALLEKVRTIKGRRWHSCEKYWTIPWTEEIVQQLVNLFKLEPVKIHSNLLCADDQEQGIDVQGLQKALDNELKLKGYSQKTRKSYLSQVKRFLEFYSKDPEELDEKEVREYFLYLLEQGVSHAYINQALSGIKLLFRKVLNKPGRLSGVPR
ncbi:MAG: site-specific integrase, partial [Clostridia bacterium]|nr:site-specific integrase [Clostridia bacterium]